MRQAIITIGLLLCLCALGAQATPPLSAVAPPVSLSTSGSPPKTACHPWVKVNGGWRQTGVVNVSVGSLVALGASGPSGTTPPASMTVNSGRLDLGSFAAENFVADQPGEWRAHFDAPGCGFVETLSLRVR